MGHVAGHGENVGVLLQSAARGDARAGVFGGFHHGHPHRHAADNPVANGEILRRRKGAERELRDQRSAKSENLLRQPRIFLGIGDVDPCAENGDGLAFCRNRAPVAGGVNPARHSTYDNQSLHRQVARQTLRHPRAVRRGMASADHRDARLRQHFGIPANIENDGRMVNFFHTWGIGRIVQRDQGHIRRGCARNFLSRPFGRLSRGPRLRRDRLNTCAFQFRE